MHDLEEVFIMYPGINIESRDGNGNTLLILASINGNVEIVKFLLFKNSNVNATNVFFLYLFLE